MTTEYSVTFRDDSGDSIKVTNIVNMIGFGTAAVRLDSASAGWRRPGVSIRWAGFAERVLSIEFDTLGADWKTAAAERRRLLAFFADMRPKILECERYDGAKLYLSPVHLATASQHPMHERPFLPEVLQFVAAFPYFKRDIPETSVPLEIPLLEWPEDGLEWPDGGIEFSEAGAKITVTNNGDIDADTVFTFSGPAVEPYIYNAATEQRLEVDRTLGATDVLEVNSATGRVDIVEQDGTRNNAFNFLSDGSEFVRLARGVNSIEYGSAGGAGSLSVRGVEYYASL